MSILVWFLFIFNQPVFWIYTGLGQLPKSERFGIIGTRVIYMPDTQPTALKHWLSYE